MPTAKIFGGGQPSANKTTNITNGRRRCSCTRDPFVDGFPRAFQLAACRAMKRRSSKGWHRADMDFVIWLKFI